MIKILLLVALVKADGSFVIHEKEMEDMPTCLHLAQQYSYMYPPNGYVMSVYWCERRREV